MATSIVLILVLATYCSNVIANHLVTCPDSNEPDCICLEKMRRAMTDCKKNPGCNGQYCGGYQIGLDFYTDCYCQTVDGKCLRPDLCDGKSPEYKKNFLQCTLNLPCSMRCVNAYQTRYAHQIKECKGETLCEKRLISLVRGPFDCKKDIDEIFIKRFNDKSPCPCSTYSK